jgi:hypothetical protein
VTLINDLPQPRKKPCENCGSRLGTEIWSPGGTIAYVHGMFSLWCTVCVLEAQLKHAREQAALIPDLQAKLVEALKS